MPKQKITRDMILAEGYRLATEEGMDQVQVKIIAKNLGCSVQPVYSCFKNMEDLKNEILALASEQFMSDVKSRLLPDENIVLSFGHGMLLSAAANPNLFECFQTRLKTSGTALTSLFNEEAVKALAEQLGIAQFQAKDLLAQVVIYCMGLIPMIHTDQVSLQEAGIMLSKAYDAFYLFAERK